MIRFKELVEGYMPTAKTRGSVGFDVKSREAIEMKKGELYKIGLGVRLSECPINYYLELHPRSSFRAKVGVEGIGVIDSAYRNEIMMLVKPDCDYTLEVGERIGQLIPKSSHAPIMDCPIESNLRDGGLGSTGLRG